MNLTPKEVLDALKVLTDYLSVEPAPPTRPAPLSCIATCFGYEDPGDNGKGAWGANTADPGCVGVSLPIPIVQATMGGISSKKVAGWTVSLIVDTKGPIAHVAKANIDIVDLGPGEHGKLIENRDGVLVALDMTKGLCDALGIVYDARHASFEVEYWIVNPQGEEVPILGTDGPRVTV